MAATPSHCSSCGTTDREEIASRSYSGCCNKTICDGPERFVALERFGTPDDFVRACCWGEAEKVFASEGREIPDGSCNLTRSDW